MKIRVCVSGDQNLFRKLLVEALRGNEDIDSNIHEASNGKKLLQSLSAENTDVVLIDMSAPDIESFQIADAILRRFPSVRLIVIATLNSPSMLSHLFNLGVNGLLSKDCEPKEIIEAIRSVYINHFYLNQATEKVVREANVRGEYHSSLSRREMDVLIGICNELTSRQIGENLSISAKTVENHRIHMLKKLGAKNIVGLVKYAYRHKILPAH